jgi:hypothetical protein
MTAAQTDPRANAHRLDFLLKMACTGFFPEHDASILQAFLKCSNDLSSAVFNRNPPQKFYQ